MSAKILPFDDEYERLVREPARRHYEKLELEEIRRLEREIAKRKRDFEHADFQPPNDRRARTPATSTANPQPADALPYVDLAAPLTER